MKAGSIQGTEGLVFVQCRVCGQSLSHRMGKVKLESYYYPCGHANAPENDELNLVALGCEIPTSAP